MPDERRGTLGDDFDRFATEWAKKHEPQGVMKDGSLLAATEAAAAVSYITARATARIIPGPTCERCGGTREVSPFDSSSQEDICPACHGEQPVYIVMQEAWGLARRIVKAWVRPLGVSWEDYERDLDTVTDAIGSALLGGEHGGRVERAREVWRRCEMKESGHRFWHSETTLLIQDDEPFKFGDRIALLEPTGQTERTTGTSGQPQAVTEKEKQDE